ncbi:NAD-dependent dehydratase [Candidatus Kaiserbacteria bacterium CG10_big_fil_rev_8_21_14_0_10_59_10]|uniref:NAD-dependent dehydratase n=1 Tax=Candidatus Kaiserbacteria bacterium CG10_big_fil_rev_8_21_14_0_10_59_10 TaxID=1974612 RepID=A0A2H0U7P0_9BACT|nr:MAG: NAD-dependent dehydratase [Candidatus Kaiserbacteria bacterium CG10_big_fil_rev_8_21_14_0_10_59_10]
MVKKKVLILGGDGYLGWPTAMYFSRKGHDVAVVDNFIKRQWEAEVEAEPLIPIPSLQQRIRIWKQATGKKIRMYVGNLAHERFVARIFRDFKPDVIIHYGEQPSAPFSMMGNERTNETQINNVVGTLNVIYSMKRSTPEAHLIKLGTMGEYGTPNIDIEEGWITITHKGRKDRMLFPKKPGSFYHLSKVHDSNNLEFACRVWGLRVTDLNQGVVYGMETEETKLADGLHTSFHYDDIFGTALNRFCVQAVAGVPITPYGKGGQKRGFLNIVDTLRCVELAALHPAKKGEFRVFNQFTEVFSIRELAEKVKSAAADMGIRAKIRHVRNPRTELEQHYYNPVHRALPKLGLKPHLLSDVLVESMLAKIIEHKDLINEEIIMPRVLWVSKTE